MKKLILINIFLALQLRILFETVYDPANHETKYAELIK